eukprot:SAG31_NODE_34060_length_337_cov_0.647059_1_plen_22_part_10
MSAEERRKYREPRHLNTPAQVR